MIVACMIAIGNVFKKEDLFICAPQFQYVVSLRSNELHMVLSCIQSKFNFQTIPLNRIHETVHDNLTKYIPVFTCLFVTG